MVYAGLETEDRPIFAYSRQALYQLSDTLSHAAEFSWTVSFMQKRQLTIIFGTKSSIITHAFAYTQRHAKCLITKYSAIYVIIIIGKGLGH